MLARFIPAGAGNTCAGGCTAQCAAVYPRWRGEHNRVQRSITNMAGLSPLARGTLAFRWILVPGRRFIPAGAGNTPPPGEFVPAAPVYPRWRGEHSGLATLHELDTGLSPLARGTRRDGQRADEPMRFIPAGAGNTERRGYSRRTSAVYPRWRGEHD